MPNSSRCPAESSGDHGGVPYEHPDTGCSIERDVYLGTPQIIFDFLGKSVTEVLQRARTPKEKDRILTILNNAIDEADAVTPANSGDLLELESDLTVVDSSDHPPLESKLFNEEFRNWMDTVCPLRYDDLVRTIIMFLGSRSLGTTFTYQEISDATHQMHPVDPISPNAVRILFERNANPLFESFPFRLVQESPDAVHLVYLEENSMDIEVELEGDFGGNPGFADDEDLAA